MYYIELDGDTIVNLFQTNDGRDGLTISKTKANRIKWDDGKVYKYIDGDVVIENDPQYSSKKLAKAKDDKIESIYNEELRAMVINSASYASRVAQVDSATTIEELESI